MKRRLGLLAAALAVGATVCVTALAGSQVNGVTKTKFVIGGTFPLRDRPRITRRSRSG